MKLYVRLAELLEERKMTQKELAGITDIRPAAISELTNNQRRSINRDHLERIAKALEITDISDLLSLQPIEGDKQPD